MTGSTLHMHQEPESGVQERQSQGGDESSDHYLRTAWESRPSSRSGAAKEPQGTSAAMNNTNIQKRGQESQVFEPDQRVEQNDNEDEDEDDDPAFRPPLQEWAQAMFVPLTTDFAAPLRGDPLVDDDLVKENASRRLELSLAQLDQHAARVDANFQMLALREVERLRAVCLRQEREQIAQHHRHLAASSAVSSTGSDAPQKPPWPQTVQPLHPDEEGFILRNMSSKGPQPSALASAVTTNAPRQYPTQHQHQHPLQQQQQQQQQQPISSASHTSSSEMPVRLPKDITEPLVDPRFYEEHMTPRQRCELAYLSTIRNAAKQMMGYAGKLGKDRETRAKAHAEDVLRLMNAAAAGGGGGATSGKLSVPAATTLAGDYGGGGGGGPALDGGGDGGEQSDEMDIDG